VCHVIVMACLAWLALGGRAAAQQDPGAAATATVDPEPVAWPRVVIDAHGASSGVPSEAGFYPPLPADTRIAARGFGVAGAGHVYFGTLGAARLGVGASVTAVRATQDSTSLTMWLLAPQLSFNFGTPQGWSYVSGGAGAGGLDGRLVAGDNEASQSRASGVLSTLSVGAGARWFITSHVAVSFDLRLHRIGANGEGEGGPTKATIVGAASVGLSFK